MQTLNSFLQSQNLDSDLIAIFDAFQLAVQKIAKEITISTSGYAGTQNASGEDQLKLDVVSDFLMTDAFRNCSSVYMVASEEQDDVQVLNENGRFSLAYDPLDGSSLVDVNFAVGTILAVYEGKEFFNRTPREMKAAAYVVYGPRTTIVLSFGKGVCEFILRDGSFELSRENLQIKNETKNFAPGNLKACITEQWYKDLVDKWIMNGYKLRYSGGMVPDINHILIKGNGVFTYPGTQKEPNGKLRLLIECGPMAFIVENAGGISSDGKISILDKKIEGIHQRTPIFIGSSEEVKQINL